jgi:LacI family transcriptional regulator
MDYRPNRLAQNLSRGKTMNIMVLLNDLQNPFYATMASRVVRTLEASHYHALPVETWGDAHRERKMLMLASQYTCDGVLCLEALPQQSPEVYADIARRVPCIIRHHVYGDLAFQIDQAAGRQAVDYGIGLDRLFAHLEAIGASRLGLLLHSQHDPRRPEKDRSIRAQFLLSRLAKPLRDGQVAIGSLNDTAPLDDWYAAARIMLIENPDIDALFVHHLRAMPAVLTAIEERGRRAGRDIAVASTDDDTSAKWLRPGVTVVSENVGATVTAMVAGLLNWIADKKKPLAIQETDLIVRESTSGFTPGIARTTTVNGADR